MSAIQNIIIHLPFYDLLVDISTRDDASEHRNTVKTLAPKSATQVLQDHFPADLLDLLNTESKLVSPTHNPQYAKNLDIMIGADMPC